jgi:hypothetical protein
MRVAPDQPSGQPLGVRVDQELIRVETESLLRLVRPMHAIAIELSGRDIVQIAMPDIFAALGQRDAFQFALALVIEQAKLHLRRIGGKQREVGAPPIPCCAKRMRGAG